MEIISKHIAEEFYELFRYLSAANWKNKLMQKLYSLWNNPVALVDYSHHIICKYDEELENARPTPVEALWKDFFHKGFLPDEWIDDEFFLNYKKIKGDTVNYFPESNIPSYVTPVIRNDICYGYLAIYRRNNEIDESYYPLIIAACNIIGIRLLEERMFQKSYPAQLIQDILDGKIVESEDIKRTLKVQKIKEKKYKQMIYIKSFEMGQNSLEKYIARRIAGISGQIVTLFGSDYIGVYIEADQEAQVDNMREQAGKILEIVKKSAGVSDIFSSLISVPSFFAQARRAFEFGEETRTNKTFHYFSDYKMEYFWTIVCQDINCLECYNKAAITLAEYDKANGTNLIQTLYTYLKFNRSILRCSGELHIHKNTVTKHLNRIQDIVNINFDNPDECLHIILTYEMMKRGCR